MSSIKSEDILDFMSKMTDGKKQITKKLRFALLSAFFNFVKNSLDSDFQNPCDSPALKKLFRAAKTTRITILDKDVVDEIIFRTRNPRNRLIIELMARSCMRIGEVLKLTPSDIEDRKAIIREPKSGKETETAFLPLKVAERHADYISDNEIWSDARIFPITYAASRMMLKKARDTVGVHVRPHDFRRHGATYASRSGVPIEIVSKVLLRHSNLSTTQKYLGKSSDAIAMRWIDNIHG